MREILSRGKRIDNDEWVEGDLIVSKNNYYIHPTHNSFQVKESGLSGPIVLHEVREDTVGQFTGMTDKNGKKIFEGDVLAIDVSKKFAVCYGEGKFYMDGTAIPIRYSSAFKVIGNIHDNPELLEGDCDGKNT